MAETGKPKKETPENPLSNIRHERFCQLYAGECFGFASRAYKEAGYKSSKLNGAVEADASRLIRNANVWARIQHLRGERIRALDIDATRILEMRLDIARDGKRKDSDRIAALKDIERSLGLEAPQKVDHTTAGEPIQPPMTIFRFVSGQDD